MEPPSARGELPEAEPRARDGEERTRWRRWLIRVGLFLGVVGGVALYVALTPRSQPCWPRPDGAIPPALRGPVEPTVTAAALEPRGPLTISFAGDAMFGRGVARRLRADPRSEPLRHLRSTLERTDLWVMNLESAVSGPHPPWPWKQYHFRLPSELAARALEVPLPAAAHRMAAMANNHALDHGRPGLEEGIRTVNAAGYAVAGVGADAEAAWAPARRRVAGVEVGLLAVADHCGCLDMCGWLATDTRSGMSYLYLSGGEWEPLVHAVRRLRPEVGVLIVSVHWGPNYFDGPASWQRDLAHALIDAGADVVHGHSAHHLLPVERYRGKHIFYALGDLVNDYAPRPRYRNDLGAVAELTFDAAGGQSLRAHPHRIRDGQPHPLDHTDPDHALALQQLGLDAPGPAP